jgi:hypothetical protein
MFLAQWIFDWNKKRVSQELLALDKKTLFSKKGIQEKVEYDLHLFKGLVWLIMDWKINTSSHFNINVETIDFKFSELSEELFKIKWKTNLLVIELLENCYENEEFIIPLNSKQKLIFLKNEFDLFYSLDDTPNYSSNFINYWEIGIDEVKFDIKQTQKIFNDMDSFKVRSFLQSSLLFAKEIWCSQVVFEWIETIEMYDFYLSKIEPYFKVFWIKVLYQGYLLEMPWNI